MVADNGARLLVSLEARVNKFERDLGRANGTARREFGSIERRSQQMANRLETTVTQASTRIESRFKGLSASFATAAGALKGSLVGFAAGLASSASLGSVKATVAELAKLNDVAERTGASSKFLQEFAFGVRQSGGEAADAAAGMQKFSINVSKAAAGGGDLAKVFEANGVAVADAAGKMRPIEDLLGDFAELVKNAEGEQDQLNLATMAFGRSAGPALVLALANGKAGMAEMAAQARKAGAVLEEDLIKKAADLDDKFAEVEDRIAGLGKRIAIEFAGPAVEASMNTFLGFLQRIKEELEALRNMDVSRLARALAERTGPGYLMSWLPKGEPPPDLAKLEAQASAIRLEMEKVRNLPLGTLPAGQAEQKLAKLRADLSGVEDQIKRINEAKVEPGVTPLKEIEVRGKKTVIPSEGDGGGDPKLADLAGGFRSSLKEMIAAAKEAGHNISILSGRRTVERQQQLWQQAVAKYGSEAEARKWVAPPGRSMHNKGMAADLSYAGSGLKATSADAQAARMWAHQNAGQFGLTFPLGNEPWHVEPAGGRGRNAGQTEEDKRAEAIKRVMEALRLETDQIGKTEVQQRILQEVQAAGVDLNSKEGQGIAATVQQLYALKDASEKAAGSTAELKRAREEFASIGADATKSFVAELRAGKSAAEALSGALDRILTKLTDNLIDSLFQNLFAPDGGGAGASGGLLGGIGKLFGFAKGGVMTSQGPRQLQRYASGGVSSKAAIFGEAGPEAAVPLPDGRRIPVDLKAPKMPKGQTSRMAPMQNRTTIKHEAKINIDITGAMGRQEMADVARAAAAQGAQTAYKQAIKDMPAALDRHQRLRG